MNKILRPITPFAVAMALVALAGCYSRILPEPPRARQGVLAVAGAPNARDLGGLPGHDGRAVRWGLLVRSGELDMLTPAARDFLFGLGGDRMGIGTVVDFRCAALRLDFAAGGDLEVGGISSERTRAPGRMPDGVLWQGDTGIPEMADLRDVIRRDTDFDSVVRDVTQWYRNLVRDHRERYLEFFGALLAADGPVLFHCSTGKDRTGVAAALLLMALGVSDADIVANYMLSKDLVYERLFPVVPFLRGEMARDMREKRPSALILVNAPGEAGPVLEDLRAGARRDVLRQRMQGAFSGLLAGDPGMSPGDAAGRAGDVVAGIASGLDSGSTDPEVQAVRDAIDLAFGVSRDWMLEIGGIPGDGFDRWVEDFVWDAGNKVKPHLSVFPQWIGAALAEVRDEWGGIEGFLNDHGRFGMDGAGVVAALRELYLED